MYEYLSKPYAGKSKTAKPAPDSKPAQRRSFAGLSANQKGKDSEHLLDKAFHEKVFGEYGKADIHNDPENISKRLPIDDHRYTSDKPAQMRTSANTQGTDNRSEREPVVQRLLDITGYDKAKHSNIIKPRILWNDIFTQLISILPPELQTGFSTSVEVLEASFSVRFSYPKDNDFTEMVNCFVKPLSTYVEEKHEVGSVEEEAKKAGGSYDVQTNTGKHVNRQEKVHLDGTNLLSGSSRFHGPKANSKKQYGEYSKKEAVKVAKDVRQYGFAFKVKNVADYLKRQGMSEAAKVLDDFYTQNRHKSYH